MIKTNTLEYRDDEVVLEGFYAFEDNGKQKPAVLVCHDWSGQNDFARNKAKQLAELGYIGFALDMFGKGKLGKTKEEKSALIQPFMADRAALQKRIFAALAAVKTLDAIDQNKIAAIGFCFGGLCVLDLARMGADIKAVVSFHGLLQAPENISNPKIKAKILALHGYDDPMATPDQAMNFCNALTKAKADWELTMYSQTMHAFTNPEANDPGFGTVYNKKADTRSWIAMKEFLKEAFE